MGASAKSIVIYTQPGCLFCGKVKEYLVGRGVAFAERDVSEDEQAMNWLEDQGFFATPVTVIDGQAIVGFNKARLEVLLGRSDKED